MKNSPVYSTLFSCLYDEQEPVGSLGRGTHYSIFRCAEWLDVIRQPLAKPEVHDFAVIWDEDHDTRVFEAVEGIYMAGLLSPVQFIGERKGTLTVITAARFNMFNAAATDEYERQLNSISTALPSGDSWPTTLGMFDRSPNSPPTSPHQTEVAGLIHDTGHRVVTYLRNIDSLWSLGTKPWRPARVPPSAPTPWAPPGFPVAPDK